MKFYRAKFGVYGEKPGDGAAILSVEDQHKIIMEETSLFLQQLSATRE